MKRIHSASETLQAIERVLASPDPQYIGRISGGLSLTAIYKYLRSEEMDSTQVQEMRALTGFYAPESIFQEQMREYGKLELEALRSSTVCVRNSTDSEETANYLESLVEGFIDTVHVWSTDAIYEWIPLLSEKKVLIVSPFAETMEAQWAKRSLLHTSNPEEHWNFQFPQIDMEFLKAPLTVTGCEPFKYESWFRQYFELCTSALNKDFDIALISCGSYAQPLGAFLQSKGKKAWLIGGILQAVFGIRGMRWSRCTTSIGNSYNEHWVAPSVKETPRYNPEVRELWDNYWENCSTKL